MSNTNSRRKVQAMGVAKNIFASMGFSQEEIINAFETMKQKKTVRSYVRAWGTGEVIGCVLASKDENKINVGFSSLHINDKPTSRCVAGKIAELATVLLPDRPIPKHIANWLSDGKFLGRCMKYFKVDNVQIKTVAGRNGKKLILKEEKFILES
jgi:hypothetical protein